MNDDGTHLVAVLLDQGRPDKAWDEIAPLLAARPDDPGVQLLAARAALGTGQADDALRLVEAALGHRPEEADAHAVHALALGQVGRHHHAAVAAQEAVAAQPWDWRMHAVGIVLDLAGVGVTPRTQTALAEVLRLAPDDPDAQNLAGIVETRRRYHRRARLHFEAALAIDPGHEGARDGLARLGLRRLDLAGGVETASSLLAASPNDDRGMDLLRATWHRAVWLLCLAPFVVAQISRLVVPEPDQGDPRTAAETGPAVLVLLVLLVLATGAWVWFVHRSVPGGLPRLVRILPATYPALLGWVACAVIAIVLCAVAAGQPVQIARGCYMVAAALSILPGILLGLLERRRIRHR